MVYNIKVLFCYAVLEFMWSLTLELCRMSPFPLARHSKILRQAEM